MDARFATLIARIRKPGAGKPVPATAEIMGNMAEFLAELAEDAAKQTEENLKLSRQLIWLTRVLAALTFVLFLLTAYLCYDQHLHNKRIEEQSHNSAQPQITKP